MKVSTVALLVIFLFSTSTLTAVLTQQKAVEAAVREASTDNSRPYDEKAYELLLRMSEYNDFTDEEKEYLRAYLGMDALPTEKEIQSFVDQQPSTSSEVVLFRLIENSVPFGKVSAVEWDNVSKYFGNLSDEQIKELRTKSISTREALQINLTMLFGMFSLSEAERLVKMYPNDRERGEVTFNLYLYTYGNKNPSSVLQSAKDMLLRGMDMATIIKTLNLTADIQSIVFENAGDGSFLPSRGDPNVGYYDPTAPFSINNGSGDVVDIISGNLSYIYDILSLPGVSGFGLDLSLIYNSSDAALYDPHYMQGYSYTVWYAPYYLFYNINSYTYDASIGYKIFDTLTDAQNFVNANNYSLLDSQQGWEPGVSMWWKSGSMDGYTIAEYDMFNSSYPYYFDEVLTPSSMYVTHNNGGTVYGAYIPSLRTEYTYYYEEELPNYCMYTESRWTTYYTGWVYGVSNITYTVYCSAIGYYASAPMDTNYITDSFEINGLGAGWNWNLPYIDYVWNGSGSTGYATLHLGNGQAYTIPSYSIATGQYTVVNHPLQDFEVWRDTTYSNGQFTSAYRLVYATGELAYFDSSGRLIAQKDRFNNTITYKYTLFNGNYVMNQIVDSGNRWIALSYTNKVNGWTVKVTAPSGASTIISMERIIGAGSSSSPYNHYALRSITDSYGAETFFDYEYRAGEFNLYQSVNLPTALNRWALLTKVTYPTMSKTEFTYSKYSYSFGSYGFRDFYRVTGRKDVIGVTNYNVKTYAYTSTSTGNGNFHPSNLAANATFQTVVTDNNDPSNNLTTTYAFSKAIHPTTGNIGLLLASETLKKSGVTVSSTSNTVFNANFLPLETKVRVYNSSGNFIEKVYSYSYDSKGNLTAFWDERANGNTSNTEYKTTYVYDTSYGNFNMLTSKTYKQDASTTITETYTLTSDKKSISIVEIRVNGVLKAKTQYYYNSRGEVTSQRDYKDGFSNFVETSYTYSTSGLLESIATTNIKDADGIYVTGTPGLGSVSGRLAQRFVYNYGGLLIYSIDARGNYTCYLYDAMDRIAKVSNPDGTFIAYEYDNLNNVTTVTDERGYQLKYYYDGFGNLLRIYDVFSGQNLITNTYDAKMRLSTTNNHNNSAQSAQTAYTYDHFGRVLSIQTKDKSNMVIASETYVYDDAFQSQFHKTTHTIVGDVNAPSIVTSTYLNKSNLLEKQSRTIGGVEYFDYFTYDYLGNLLTEKTAIAVQNYNYVPYTAKYEYDYAGRVVKQYNVAGHYATFVYDALGRMVSSTNYSGRITTYEYDDLGRLLLESMPFESAGISTYYSVSKHFYDGDSNVTKVLVTNNQPGNTTSYSKVEYQYNSRNWLTQETQYDGSTAYYTTYTYYNDGLLKTMVTGNGAATTTYSYDHRGNVTSIKDALNRLETFFYDTNGNLVSSTDRNSWSTSYTYDGLGRVLTTNVNTGNPTTNCSQTFVYTLTGELRSENNGTFNAINTYDALGRLSSVSESNNVTKAYAYDIADNRLTYTLYVNGVQQLNTSYTYDQFNRLETVKENGSTVATYTYDLNGNRASLTYANGTSETYTYNIANLVTSVVNKAGSTVLSSYNYTYFLDGNQRTKTDNIGKITTYSYDGLGRLTGEVETLYGSIVQSYTYTYNAAHNRISMTASGTLSFSTSYTYNLINQLLTETKSSVTTTYTYDNNGNQITQSTPLLVNTFSYNGLNQLLSANVGGTSATYAYDSAGFRVSKTVGGVVTKHVWDGNKVSIELNASNTVTAKYIRGLDLLASENSGVRVYFLYNAHGDVVQLTNTGGTITKTYEYDAFGVEKNPNPSDTNPFRYCCAYYDKETGNYYLFARYYNPALGRFLSEDPIGYGLNWYTYANNNPVMFIDPTGMAEWWQWAIAGGQVVLGTALCATGVGGGAGAWLIAGGALSMITYTVEPAIGQAIGGGTSMINGYNAASTGVSLWSFGLPGQIAGSALILVGATTMIFGANEIVDAVTGTNYIWEVYHSLGWSDSAYNLSYLGLNATSSVGTATGRWGMRLAGTKTIGGHDQLKIEGQKPYARITRGDTITNFDGRGNVYWARHNAFHGSSTNPHWHIGAGGGQHYSSYLEMIIRLARGF